jgi:hypothetical protein
LATQHRVAAEDARVTVGKPYLAAFKAAHWTIVIVSETAVFSKGQTWNSLIATVGFDGLQQLAKSDLAFAAARGCICLQRLDAASVAKDALGLCRLNAFILSFWASLRT